MAGVTMSLTGVPELLEAMQALGAVGSRQAMQAALKKGADVTADAARAMAPRGPLIGPCEFKDRPLAETILVRTTLNKSQKRKRGARRAEAEVFVGSSAPHAHLVEFGHVLARYRGRVVAGKGRGAQRSRVKEVVGHVPPHQFMRPAYDATKTRATKVVFEHLGIEVARVARRYRRQAERGRLSRGARQAFRLELGL